MSGAAATEGRLPAGWLPTSDDEIPTFIDRLGLRGIVDLHVHALPERLQAAVWRYFDGLEDPSWPIVYRLGSDVRLQRLAELGVVRHTALAYAHRPGMAAALNEHTLGLAEQDERIIPTFTFHPEDGVEDYVRAALDRGAAVAKVHLQVGRFHATDPRLDRVWDLLAATQVAVVIHAGAVYGVEGGHEYCGADEIDALLGRHPDLRLVVAHLGAPDFADFLDLAGAREQLWMDTAMAFGSPELIGSFPVSLVDRLRPLVDRLVFGSDYPSIPITIADQLRGLHTIGLDAAGWRALLHDNALRLLSWRRPLAR